MGGSGDHAEIMDGDAGIDDLHQLGHFCPHMQHGFIIGDDGVHVDHRVALKLFFQRLFRQVDGVMQLHQVAVGGHLCVEGDHHPARAVVVHHHVVNGHNGVKGQHGLLDAPHQLRIGGLPQQGADRVPGSVIAGVQDEAGHRQAHPAIDIHMEKMGDQGGGQNSGGGQAVAEAVGGCGLHGRGLNLFAHRPVVAGHI